jgi:HNH endonuclease
MAIEIISRSDAKATGLKRYFTGKMCVNGHTCERDVKAQYCIECRKLPKFRKYPKLAAWQKQYNEKNATKLRSLRKKWYSENEQRRKELHKIYYEKNKEQYSDQGRTWRLENAERAREIGREYRAKHPGKAALTLRRLRKLYPERYKAYQHGRRALKLKNGGKHSASDIADIFKLQKGKCANTICRKSLDTKYHLDHIIALKNGGRNDRRNLQLMCQSCNMRKSAKDPFRFARENGLLL